MRWRRAHPLPLLALCLLPGCYTVDFVDAPVAEQLGTALVGTMDQVRGYGACDGTGLYFVEREEDGAVVASGLATGVAGVGRGYLAGALELARVAADLESTEDLPDPEEYLQYAVGAARFLMGHATVSSDGTGGLSWNQCLEVVPSDGDDDSLPGCGADEPPSVLEPAACPASRATPATGLRHGVAGVGDFLLELYEAYDTADLADPDDEREGLLAAAEGAGRWLLAHSLGTDTVAFWPAEVPLEGEAARYPTGLSEGAAGIGYFLLRLSSAVDEAGGDGQPYRDGALRAGAWLEALMEDADGEAGPVPPVFTPGDPDPTLQPAAGLYDGNAGVAYFFMFLYQETGDTRFARAACTLLTWLSSSEVRIDALRGTTWPLPPTFDGRGVGTDLAHGAAGIGWAFLQGWRALHDDGWLELAGRAGTWLSNAEVGHFFRGKAFWSARIDPYSEPGIEADGSWQEGAAVAGLASEAPPVIVYPGLLRGVSGIAWYLKELGFDQAEPTATLDIAGQATTWLYYEGEQVSAVGSVFLWPTSIARQLSTREIAGGQSVGYEEGMAGITAWLAEAHALAAGGASIRAASVLGLVRLDRSLEAACELESSTREGL